MFSGHFTTFPVECQIFPAKIFTGHLIIFGRALGKLLVSCRQLAAPDSLFCVISATGLPATNN